METVERDFSDKGVKFHYIYKALAHPENNGYVAPFNLKERLMHVAEAKQTLGSRIQWLCDSMDNDLKHALGDRPNSEFVIGPDGKILISRSWSSPSQLRTDLEELVGKVDNPTSIQDLKMKTQPPPSKAQSGIVTRIQLPGQMSPLKITPSESKSPHYAKLRAESNGNKIYLGFFLDRLYKVHWNNKAPALEYSIEAPQGVTVTPELGKGPKVEADADTDPREFLVEVTGRSSEPLKLTVKYFACDDAETFCVPVTQEYLVSFERDRDGGSRRANGAGRPTRGGQARGGQARGGQARGGPMQGNPSRGGGQPGDRMQQMMARLPVMVSLDLNGDGKLSAKEIDAAPQSLLKADANGDGDIGADEIGPTSFGGATGRGGAAGRGASGGRQSGAGRPSPGAGRRPTQNPRRQ